MFREKGVCVVTVDFFAFCISSLVVDILDCYFILGVLTLILIASIGYTFTFYETIVRSC